MKYLVLAKDHPPFYTKWFEYENHWQEGMTVINLMTDTYTVNGTTWKEIDSDHL